MRGEGTMRSTTTTTTTTTMTMTVKQDDRRDGGDINWKMSTEQQVTTDRWTRANGTDGTEDVVERTPPAGAPPSAAVVDGENNPIKSLRRQRHCDTATGMASTNTTSITASTMPIASDTADRHRLRRATAIGYREDEDEGPDGAYHGAESSGDCDASPPMSSPSSGAGEGEREDDGVSQTTTTTTTTTTTSDGKNSLGHDTTNNNNRSDLYPTPRRVDSGAGENFRQLVGEPGEDSTERRQHKTINARRRWKLLAKALRHDSSEDDQLLKFNLIEADRAGDEKDENVYVYRLYDRYRLKIRLIGPERPWTASELIGFNNTGNICVWPSEEALAYYVLSRLAQFDGTRVLELGGGMTCMAGLVLAKYGQPAFVHVTDGNELSVENVRQSLVLNKFNCTIKSSVLKWERSAVPCGGTPPEGLGEQRYQFVLSADCLFFDESRSQLIDTIWHLLADEGVALITAPRRGHTLSQFLDECVARGFHYELLQCYNEAIWARHLELKLTEGYDENIHYPLLVKMYKYAHGPVLHRL